MAKDRDRAVSPEGLRQDGCWGRADAARRSLQQSIESPPNYTQHSNRSGSTVGGGEVREWPAPDAALRGCLCSLTHV